MMAGLAGRVWSFDGLFDAVLLQTAERGTSMPVSKGELVELGKGRVCVIVGVEEDENIPEGHFAAWFGEINEAGVPIIWTVPAAYFKLIEGPFDWRH